MKKIQIAISFLFFIVFATYANSAEVRKFSPQGKITSQTRIDIIFTEDMVELGQTGDVKKPFIINCSDNSIVESASGQWVEPNHYSWQLAQPLSPRQKCEFTINEKVLTLKNEKLKKQKFSFYTGGPKITEIYPDSSEVEADQIFIISADFSINETSLIENSWCEVEGIGQKIPIKLASVKEQKQVFELLEVKSPAKAFSCSQNFPLSAKLQINISEKIKTTSGILFDQKFSRKYRVRAPFKVELTCSRSKTTCSPLTPIYLEFNNYVDNKYLDKIYIRTADGIKKGTVDDEDYEGKSNVFQKIKFTAPWQEGEEITVELPSDLIDIADKQLSNKDKFPLKVKLGELPALAKFSGNFGILELKEGGVLPLTIRNLENEINAQTKLFSDSALSQKKYTTDVEIIKTINNLEEFDRKVEKKQAKINGEIKEFDDYYVAREYSFFKTYPISDIENKKIPKIDGNKSMEVVGIPLKESGFYVVEIKSKLLGESYLATDKPMYARTSALVTNMAVHFKNSDKNALVWVTALDTGKAVANVDIKISNFCGKELWNGKTNNQGLAISNQPITEVCMEHGGLFISARKDGDFSFVRSIWDFGIENWRFDFGEYYGDTSRKLLIHTVFDRPLFRAGETVSMKLIARENSSEFIQTNKNKFLYPKIGELSKKLIIEHYESESRFEQDVNWDDKGGALSEWKIPDNAKRGEYSVFLEGETNYQLGSFRVSDFRLPVFSGNIGTSSSKTIYSSKLPINMNLSFINGGMAKDAKVSVSATINENYIDFPKYSDYSFNSYFSDSFYQAFNIAQKYIDEKIILDKKQLTLDEQGSGKIEIEIPKIISPKKIYSEMSFNDPNGEVQSIGGYSNIYPASILLGINISGWLDNKSKKEIKFIAVDLNGKPVYDKEIKLLVKKVENYSHRRRVVGGFYSFEHSQKFIDVPGNCSGKTDKNGCLNCFIDIQKSGEYLVMASAKDDKGNEVINGGSFWKYGFDEWYDVSDTDRMEIIPDKEVYTLNETAKIQVRSPFSQGTYLVTIEADGIIDSFTQEFVRSNALVEIPIKESYNPNVFVSVLAVRGRVTPISWYSFFQWGWREPISWFKQWWNEKPQFNAMVDLAKPAFRLGMTELLVSNQAYKLDVKIATDKTEYRPRETAVATITVKTPDGKPAANTQLSLSAVDKALLELWKNESDNIIGSMFPPRKLTVHTSTAISQVVGKRHFGKKALPAGGGGGKQQTRELLSTLLLWNPSIVTDENGVAKVNIPINDVVTDFEIVAVATLGENYFGNSKAQFRTKIDLQIIPAIPLLVREGDSYKAMVNIRNSTTRELSLAITAQAGREKLTTQQVKIPSESLQEVSWQAIAPLDINSIDWQINADEIDGEKKLKDNIKINQKIVPAIPVTMRQSVFIGLGAEAFNVPVSFPAGAIAGRGGIDVEFSDKLAKIPQGLIDYFKNYPFSCLEQKVSVATGLNDQALWQKIITNLPTYIDAFGLFDYFPVDNLGGSPALTAYVLNMALLAGVEIPKEILEKAIKGLSDYAEEKVQVNTWSLYKDNYVQKLIALEALSRQKINPKKIISIMESLDIDLIEMPTSSLIDYYLINKRLSDNRQSEKLVSDIEQEINNRLIFNGSRVDFNTADKDEWWWYMVSSDYNVFRLIEAFIDNEKWKNEIPKLIRGAIERQKNGHWSTTTANAWARVVLDKFAQKFESETVTGKTAVGYAQKSYDFDWGKFNPTAKNNIFIPWQKDQPLDKSNFEIKHQGEGKAWANIGIYAAVPTTKDISYGYKISRQIKPLVEKTPNVISRGDLWKVTINFEAQNNMTWVVLSDPIVAGGKILGEGDGRDTKLINENDEVKNVDTEANNQNLLSTDPTFVERTFDFYRAYYRFLPKGQHTITYNVRINNPGEFQLPPTRIEAMYAPDVYGEKPNKKISVRE